MKLKILNRSANGLIILSAAFLIGALAHRLVLAERNERAADEKLMKLSLENSALKLSLEGK